MVWIWGLKKYDETTLRTIVKYLTEFSHSLTTKQTSQPPINYLQGVAQVSIPALRVKELTFDIGFAGTVKAHIILSENH